MRILFLADGYPGTDQSMSVIHHRHLAESMQNEGCDIHVVTVYQYIPKPLSVIKPFSEYNKRPRMDFINGVPIHRIGCMLSNTNILQRIIWPNFPQFHARYFQQKLCPLIEEMHKTRKFDAVLVSGLFPFGATARYLYENYRLPYISMNHSVPQLSEAQQNTLLRAAYHYAGEMAYRVLCPSRRMVSQMCDLVSHARVELFFTGCKPIDNIQPDLFRLPSWAAGKRLIISVGHMDGRKRQDLLIRGFCKIANRHPDALLVLIGNGKKRQSWKQLAADCGMTERVHFLGLLPHAEVFQWLAHGFAFALASPDEAYGVVYTEAMQSGLPILLCSDAGVADQINDRVHGVKVPANDVESIVEGLEYLLADIPRAKVMGQQGRQLVLGRLMWSHHSNILIRMFEDACHVNKQRFKTHGSQ